MDLLHISVAGIAEENSFAMRFGEIGLLFADTFTYVSNCYHKKTFVVDSNVE